MKDYQLKEALANLKTAFTDMKEKFEVVIELLETFLDEEPD